MKNNTIKIFFFTLMLSLAVAAVSYARDVTLQWNAVSDTTVTGYKIYNKADSSTPPFSTSKNVGKVTTGTVTGLDAARNYYFAVTAYNAAGTESSYSNIVSVLEAVPPTVSITAPANNATVSGTVSVTATAADNVGVSKVEFYRNGTLQTTDTSTPYLYTMNAASGTYTLMAKAYDAAGNVGQSSNISITVAGDTIAPTVSLTSPANNSTVSGTTTITASASDNMGISKVEFYRSGVLLSATNVAPFNYSWNTATTANGSYTLTAKAYDNSGNVTQSNGSTVTISNQGTTNPPPTSTASTIWQATMVPPTAGADGPVQLGMKFKSDISGYISGIRFYKAAGNTGTHVGSLWSASGTRLASATFTAETATGWQQVNFSTPVAVSANTVYVASYHTTTGYYGYTSGFFATKGADNGNLHALASGVSGSNGVYAYGSSSLFPNQTWNNTNYWVDVVFSTTVSTPTPPPTSTASTIWPSTAVPATISGADSPVQLGMKFKSDTSGYISGIRFYKAAGNTGTHVASLWSASGTRLATATFTAETATGWQQVNFAAPVAISANTVYVASYHTTVGYFGQDSGYFTSKGADNGNLHALASGVSGSNGVFAYGSSSLFPNQSWNNCNYWVDVVFSATATTPTPPPTSTTSTIWPATTVPPTAGADSAVQLGVKFKSDINGYITGIRFYKAAGNTGTHVGSLWSASGTRLASATFTAETATGWQQVNFATPVAISANTVYVASYHTTTGYYGYTNSFFATKGTDNGNLHALASGVSGNNGVYAYGSSSLFPNQSWNNTNYWVDVVFKP